MDKNRLAGEYADTYGNMGSDAWNNAYTCYLAGMDACQQLLQQTPCTTQLPPTYAVNRVEVIDEAGRSYVNWHKKNSVEVQLQDESRTMKVFISRR